MRLVCQLVDQPASTARILYDFQDLDAGVTLNGDASGTGLNLGSPGFTSSPWALQEGERSITLPLVFVGTITSVQSNIASLSRALARPQSWLRWQASDMSTPVYFRLRRDEVGALDWQSAQPTAPQADGYRWEWPLTLTAHAFAYGELVTLPPVTLGKGGNGSTPFVAKLPPIKGDAPSMARIDITPVGSQSWYGYRTLVNISAADSQSGFFGAPNAFAGGFGTQMAGSSVATAPSGLTSYDSNNNLFCFPANQTQGQTYQAVAGGWPNSPPPGQYQAFIRVGRSASTGSANFQVGPNFFNYPLYQQMTAWNPASSATHVMSWVDCGQVTLPTGMDPSMLFDTDVMPNPNMSISVTPIDNSAQLWLDQVILIPTRLARGGTCTTMQLQYQGIAAPSSTATLRIDGDYQRVGFKLGQYFQNVAPPLVTGGYPVLSPGFSNWISLLKNTTEVNSACEDATQQVTVQVSYYPRYMHLGE